MFIIPYTLNFFLLYSVNKILLAKRNVIEWDVLYNFTMTYISLKYVFQMAFYKLFIWISGCYIRLFTTQL